MRVPFGRKIDILLAISRLAMFYENWNVAKEKVMCAKRYVEDELDCEGKNRCKVYEAVIMLVSRDFNSSAKLFLESVSTFNSAELMSYEQCVFYCVVSCIISLNRVELKEKVIDSSDIRSVIQCLP